MMQQQISDGDRAIARQQMRQQAPTLVVHGTVTDAVTGRPIAGARVADHASGTGPDQPAQPAQADAAGRYQLYTWPVLQEDRLGNTLDASAPGYETKHCTLLSLALIGPAPEAQMDIDLQPAEADEPAASGPEKQILERLAVMRASEASKSGDYIKAYALLLPAARQGHPIAQHRIGVLYTHGLGVEEDFAEATHWFRKAAEQGQGESQFSMGMRCLLGQSVAQDDTEAARWFRLAADQGVGMAASMLAELYAKGRGVPQDLVEAYKWLAVAGNQIEPTRVSVTLNDLEKKLTPAQLAEAQRRAKEFVPKRTGPADP